MAADASHAEGRPQPRRLRVGDREAGVRLDLFLAGQLSLSRAAARRLLGTGAVSLAGRRVRERDKGELLPVGASVDVRDAGGDGGHVVPEPAAPLSVLVEGDGWLAVDKPAGVPVHPLREGETGAVLNAVAARHPRVQGVGEGGLRSGVVHRLDVDTSGVLLFATRQDTWDRFRAAFRAHRTTKLYRAIVHGRMNGTGREVLDLYVAQHRPARVRVVPPGAKDRPAGTRRCDIEWRVVESFEAATLLEVRLGTGFLHQIRAMLAHRGHPVVGDTWYGAEAGGAARPMLHARYLKVEEAEATSPEPADFIASAAQLRVGERHA